VYRYSPNEHAHPRHFVLGDRVADVTTDGDKRARMKQTPGTPGTVCPYSGVVDEDGAFTHPDDKKAAMELVKHAALADMQAAFGEMLSNVARKSSSIKYTPSRRSPKPKPRFGRRDLMRALVCDHCGRDYGVFAIALFCPDCGAPNIALHFAREVELVTQQVELAEGLGKDRQELAYRLLGNAHEDVLTAFEATLKTLYLFGIGATDGNAPPKPVGNDFQNIEKGQKRFAEIGIDPFASLSAAELARLLLNIQKRHVIGHNLGIADAKFAQAATDAKLGETVQLVGADIREFAALCQKVVGALDQWLAGSPMPERAAEDTALPEEPKAQAMANDTIGDLGPLATAIGTWICKSSANGLPAPVDGDALLAAFSEQSDNEVTDAIAELEIDGFVTSTALINLRIPRIHSTDDLFLTFDPHVLGSDPIADTIELAERVLDGRESVSLADLHKESGLPLRRFNPAVAMIVAEVDSRRVSQAIGEVDYPTRYFFVEAEDRVAIRRLLKRLQQ